MGKPEALLSSNAAAVVNEALAWGFLPGSERFFYRVLFFIGEWRRGPPAPGFSWPLALFYIC